MKGDYSQPGDPYGIEEEYSAQSAASSASSGGSSSGDQRGNTVTAPRGIPTQAEADAIVRAARGENTDAR
jgi:hypothetical protein